MKALAPVFFVLILLLALVSAVSAQNKIHNPELPKHLVFQWRIETQQVHGTWSNEDFSIVRSDDKLVVYYGEYRSLEDALASLPKLPKSVRKSDVSLVPFLINAVFQRKMLLCCLVIIMIAMSRVISTKRPSHSPSIFKHLRHLKVIA